MTLKFSEEQLKKWGVSTQEEIVAALDKSKEPPKPPEPAATLTTGSTPPAFVGMVTVPEAVLARISALETSVKTLAPETILASVATEAKRVASLEISAAIAKAGGAALQQKSDPAEPTGGKPPVDPNDFAAQYDASPALKAEFVTKEGYVKYQQALAAGRIRIHARTPEAVTLN
jgi:hypothetical protein